MIRRSHGPADALDHALRTGQADDAATADLVRTAERVCATAAETQPRADFRIALRDRLMAEAAEVLVPPAREQSAPTATPAQVPVPRTRRRLAVAVSAALASVGVVGLVSTSAQAIPGDALYPVKRSVEHVELALQRSDASRGEYRFELADERLAETEELLTGRAADSGAVEELLVSFTENAQAGSVEYFDAFGQGAAPENVEAVNAFATSSAADLSALQDVAPTSATSALRDATDAVTDIAGQATRLCGTCGAADVSALTGSSGGALLEPPASSSNSSSDDVAAPRDAAPAPSAAPRSQAAAPSPEPTRSPARATASTRPSPAPSASSRPGLLKPVTEPLVGALLGDEDTEGLVPGLLNGLLGGGSSR